MPQNKAPLRALLWERIIQHSIRPDGNGGYTGGFLLPYHQALAYAEENPDFDTARVVAFAPDDRRDEFSNVAEHVTHDGAIGALLSCAAALREAAKCLKGPWDSYQKWIDTELGRLWKLRGPCPGLGAALTALGMELGVLVAYDLARHLAENEDPWPVVDRMFRDPKSVLSGAASGFVETSMMTEEMLAAVLEAVSGAKRIILVGDHRQLPPIGAGRPLADIVKHLQPQRVETLFPRVGKGYAELTINWRQDPSAPDARLAAWFSGNDPGPGEEIIFSELMTFGRKDRVQVFSWNTADECHELLVKVLQAELGLSGPDDIVGFDKSMGGAESKGNCYFNRTWDKGGVGDAAEKWQILSPVKPMPHGVIGLNRLIHRIFRWKTVEWSRGKFRKTPEPLGPEEIVYGDKVINVRNQRRWWEIYPEVGCSKYVANGEIGIAVGQFKGPQAKYQGLPWKLEVEFTSQPRFTYGFTKSDFGDEGEAPLELAYVLTVHKAQGSEFGTVILVVPNPCRLLTRELLYTALTRQKNRIVVLCQSDPTELRNYARSEHSETARRLTNLFTEPEPVVVKERRYDGKHIHRTKRGELVMSKSEIIIANQLFDRNIEYEYEKELRLGGRTCHPDFTIEDAASGLTVYWEHLGMLVDDGCRERWKLKKKWYRANGVLPLSDGGGSNGTLVETSDDPQSGFDCGEIERIIDKLFGNA